jgi:predicted membrane-bound dolichyl-phosphate-mannose-protein mannosyltransferase
MSLTTPPAVTDDALGAAATSRPADSAGQALRRIGSAVLRFFGNPAQVLGLVLLLALVSRAIWLWLPDHSLIFDEAYYVNAARVILGIHPPAGAAYAQAPLGLDPNTEHPPLGKLLIAGSMLLLGDNGIGWRFPSLVAGMVSLLALYGIVRAAGERAWLGVLAVALFAFDNLSLVHGRIATLDILFLAPALVGAWLALRGHWTAAGVALAIGALAKLTALFSVAALVAYLVVIVVIDWWDHRRIRVRDLYPLVPFLAAFAFVFVGALWLLDLRFSPYHNPVDHIAHMLEFGAKLQTTGAPSGIASDPWSWLVNQVPIHYLTVNVDTSAGGKLISSRATIDFQGALNPVLLGVLPLAAGFAFWLAWRRRSRLALWALIWGGVNYLVYYPMVLVDHRITYLYYMLPVVPAMAVATALLLDRSRLPGTVRWVFLAAFAVAFIAYFPFRQLP